VKVVASWVLALLVVIGAGVGVEAGLGHGKSSAYGEVCGVVALAPQNGEGDAAAAATAVVTEPALLHTCPSGQVAPWSYGGRPTFVLAASSGRVFKVNTYVSGGWSAVLPAGTYRTTGECWLPGPQFVVTAGQTVLGIEVVWLCGRG
jgi:hypothetical protein